VISHNSQQTGCVYRIIKGGEGQSKCPDPAAQSGEYMTETEKKLARLKEGFDPDCK
jgi:hypothetical protein